MSLLCTVCSIKNDASGSCNLVTIKNSIEVEITFLIIFCPVSLFIVYEVVVDSLKVLNAETPSSKTRVTLLAV